MKVRPWAEFRSDLPTDVIDDGDDILQYGGRSVADAIAQMLRELGCDVSPPDPQGEQGWNLYVTFERRSLWCQISHFGRNEERDDEYLFLFDQNKFIGNPFRRYHPAYLDILSKLAVALANDRRFHDVLWFEQGMEEAPGAKTPVDL